MKRWIGAAFMIAIGHAQAPDVRLNVNGVLSYQAYYLGAAALRFYDVLGRTSTLQLTLTFENQYRVFVSERWEAIPNDPSRDPFEEYYIEDQHVWHLGKQFLPFGSGHFLRENVLAARADTDLAFENLGIAVAICDGGPGAQRGITGRVGSWYGASVAVGDHFGIAPTSLDLVRHPESTLGLGHGWGNAFGLDATRRFGIYSAAFETIWLTRGATPEDHDQAVFDINGSVHTDPQHTITVGWTHQVENRADFYRLMTTFKIGQNQYLEPILRVKDSELYDVSLTLRFRL
jgi:hypothetical protein